MTTNGAVTKTQNNCGTSCRVVKYWKWDVAEIINEKSRKNVKYAVLILNRPVTQNQEFMKEFWNSATVRMTVDGGTVQWDRFLGKLSSDAVKRMKVPNLVTGDFDSITEDVLQKYKSKGCKTVHTPDEMYTDFTKALMELRKYYQHQPREIDNVIAVGQSSGRIDQILGNIQTLYLANDQNILSSNTNLFLMSDDAISWLLRPGDHVIMIPEETRKHNRAWCSLVPIGEMCQNIFTAGLKWNINNKPLKFGELISTSNTFDGSEIVKIKCSHTVLWSMRVPSLGGSVNTSPE